MRIIFLQILFLVFISCSYNNANESLMGEENVYQNQYDSTGLNYLALGDSYTIGQSVEVADRFPVILANDLKSKGLEFNAPLIIAKTGWTTDELEAGIFDADIQGTFDLVTLLIGVNNQYRGRSVEEFALQFEKLLTQAISFAGDDINKVIVVSIPDWGVSPFAEGRNREKIAMEIDLFNSTKKEICEAKNVKFVDITPISRLALNNSIFIAEDGLHFSGAMHQKWVDKIIADCF